MISNVKRKDGRVTVSWSKCYDMCQTNLSVNENWFDKNNTEDMNYEKIKDLAYSEDERPSAEPKCISHWYGLG